MSRENMKGSFIMRKRTKVEHMVIGLGIITIIGIIMSILMSGCDFGNGNKDMNDTEYTFEKAIIITGNETTVVDVKEWCDYKDSDQVQIKTKDGTVYFGSSNNIILIHES